MSEKFPRKQPFTPSEELPDPRENPEEALLAKQGRVQPHMETKPQVLSQEDLYDDEEYPWERKEEITLHDRQVEQAKRIADLDAEARSNAIDGGGNPILSSAEKVSFPIDLSIGVDTDAIAHAANQKTNQEKITKHKTLFWFPKPEKPGKGWFRGKPEGKKKKGGDTVRGEPEDIDQLDKAA